MSTLTTSITAVAAAAVAVAVYHRYVNRAEPQAFTVLSWNVLAREFTKFNKEPPGCVQGHHNPDDALETLDQTKARYTLASDAILAQAPDAVLLQELSADFFNQAFNPRAEALLSRFEIAHQTNAEGPGTAVLLRRGGSLMSTGVVFSAGASEELTGGTSKSASAVLVEIGGTRCWIVSIHLTPHKYNPEAVRRHLEMLGVALRAGADTTPSYSSPPRVIIGGDLNAEPHEVVTLQRDLSTLGGALSRVVAPGETGLSANFSTAESIDHIFISPGLRLLDVTLERQPPAGPYAAQAGAGEGATPVLFASDHVWQSARLVVD